MYLERLKLKNFRNYINLDLKFNSKVNIIIGNNAQGKTNLVESIYVLGLGKSFRTNRDKELISFNEEDSFSKGYFIKKNDTLKVQLNLTNKNNLFSRTIKIDDIDYKKTSSLLENVYIVVFSPEDLRMIKDSPDLRRRFIDKELCQIKPLYYKNLGFYKKVIFQRNKYLKENINIDEDYIYSLDHTLSNYGAYIIQERNKFIIKLKEYVKRIHSDITNKSESIDILYDSNIKVCKDIKSQYDFLMEKLYKNREKDFSRKITLLGPHKDDLVIKINDIDARYYGSQGQQRTAALSLKLAEIQIIKDEVSENPILILDDVLSELDKKRQEFLINSFSENQIFITSADIGSDVVKSIKEKNIYKVNLGKIEQIKSNF